MPWWASEPSFKEWPSEIIRVIKENPEELNSIQKLFLENNTALERLILQFQESFIIKIIHLIFNPEPSIADGWRDVANTVFESLPIKVSKRKAKLWRWKRLILYLAAHQNIQSVGPVLMELLQPDMVQKNQFSKIGIQEVGHALGKKILQKKLIDLGLNKANIQELVQNWASFSKDKNNESQEFLSKLVEASSVKGARTAEDKNSLMHFHQDDLISKQEDALFFQKDQEKKETALFIKKAGIVILHPFLPSFFGRLDLLEGKQFKNIQARQKAMFLLHFMAGGATSPMEYDLPLIKILCGWSENTPVESGIILTKEEKELCTTLLKEVAGHWKALKSTSATALRENFLKRDGKLVFLPEGGCRLLVEKKTQDILIDRLPWGLSLIKLPWMEPMLFVEWV